MKTEWLQTNTNGNYIFMFKHMLHPEWCKREEMASAVVGNPEWGTQQCRTGWNMGQHRTGLDILDSLVQDGTGDKIGQNKPEQNSAEWQSLGQSNASQVGKGRVGWDRTRQDSLGQNWTRWDRNEQHRLGQSKTEQCKRRWDRPVLCRMGQDRTGQH